MVENKFTRFLIVSFVLFALVISLFWRECADFLTNGITSIWSANVDDESMQDSNFSHIKGIRFENESRNTKQIQVDELKVVDRNDYAVTLSVQLTSKHGESSFPNLRVKVLSRSDSVLRVLDLSPADYVHDSVLTVATVQLPIQIQPGDSSFLVTAYFKD